MKGIWKGLESVRVSVASIMVGVIVVGVALSGCAQERFADHPEWVKPLITTSDRTCDSLTGVQDIKPVVQETPGASGEKLSPAEVCGELDFRQQDGTVSSWRDARHSEYKDVVWSPNRRLCSMRGWCTSDHAQALYDEGVAISGASQVQLAHTRNAGLLRSFEGLVDKDQITDIISALLKPSRVELGYEGMLIRDGDFPYDRVEVIWEPAWDYARCLTDAAVRSGCTPAEIRVVWR